MKKLLFVILTFVFLFSIAWASPVNLKKSIIYKMDGHEWVLMTRYEKTAYVIGFLSAFYWSNPDQEIRDRVLSMTRVKIKLLVLIVDDFYMLRYNRDYQISFPIFNTWIMIAGPAPEESDN